VAEGVRSGDDGSCERQQAYQGSSVGWWPYGTLPEKLADVVLSGDSAAQSLAHQIKESKSWAAQVERVLFKAASLVEECRFLEAEKFLQTTEPFCCLDNRSISQIQTYLHLGLSFTALENTLESLRTFKSKHSGP